MANNNTEELMIVAASMYYEDGLTHEQVAKRLHLSRVMVTRLLQRARREGIVQVTITRPLPKHYELQQRLKQAFGLKNAIVVRSHSSLDATLDAIGQAGAEHLIQSAFANCRLGIAWSTTVSRMAPFLKRSRLLPLVVVNELAGTILGVNPFSISGQIAHILDAPVEPLPVPVMVQNAQARDAILKETSIATALEHARQCDLAFVGLGDVGDDCTLVRAGFMTTEQMAGLRNRGAVGDILMRFYDLAGHHVPSPVERRVIGLDMDDIRRIPYVVVMAAGAKKPDALVGAMRGGLCHCVVTDTDTALEVLGTTRLAE